MYCSPARRENGHFVYTRKERVSFVITISNVNQQREICVIFSCFTEFRRKEKQKKRRLSWFGSLAHNMEFWMKLKDHSLSTWFLEFKRVHNSKCIFNKGEYNFHARIVSLTNRLLRSILFFYFINPSKQIQMQHDYTFY